jgi:phosphatidylglycerol:prolipoprotein diacylglycerol transferase
MNPVLVHLGPLTIKWYGVLISGMVLIGVYLAGRQAQRRAMNLDHLINMTLLAVILGVVGARAYHVISAWDLYRGDLYAMIATWHGGLAIYGVLIGGLTGIFIYTWWNRLSPWPWLDIAAPSLALGQAVARWGNFINQEAYGYPTNLPWAIYIAPEYRLAGYENVARYHPTFLYESIWNFLVFLFLMYMMRRVVGRLLEGEVFFAYGILYGTGRIFVEQLRIDSWTIAGFRTAQLFSLVLIGACAALLIYRRRAQRAKAGQEVPRVE